MAYTQHKCSSTAEVVDDPDTNAIDMLIDDFFALNSRTGAIQKHYEYSSEDIDCIQMTVNQLVNSTLDKAIRVCLMMGYEQPPAITLKLFDTMQSIERVTFSVFGFERAVANKAEQMLNKFVNHWTYVRHRLFWSMRLLRHWTCATAASEDGETAVKHTFVFEAKFSMPLKQQPTPQCTANVYFFFDVPAFDWRLVTEDVCAPFAYQFEGMVFEYRPSQYGCSFDFQEDILLGILARKKHLFSRLTF